MMSWSMFLWLPDRNHEIAGQIVAFCQRLIAEE
jgi:hypothetical protein